MGGGGFPCIFPAFLLEFQWDASIHVQSTNLLQKEQKVPSHMGDRRTAPTYSTRKQRLKNENMREGKARDHI